jgi:hypothetical protein
MTVRPWVTRRAKGKGYGAAAPAMGGTKLSGYAYSNDSGIPGSLRQRSGAKKRPARTNCHAWRIGGCPGGRRDGPDKCQSNIFLKFSGHYADNQESGRQHACVSALFNMMILYPSGRE